MDASNALAERSPRCPACHVEVTDDGDVRSCPRCGRAFTLVPACSPDGPVYRERPNAELVLDDAPAPVGSWLRFSDTGDALYFEIGNSTTTKHVRALAIGASILFAIMTVAMAFTSLRAAAPWLFISVLSWLAGRLERPRPGLFDRLVVRGGFLELHPQHYFGGDPAPEAVPLEDIVGVHEGVHHLTVHLKRNEEFGIASDVKVPRQVRRWVAHRIAAELRSAEDPDEGGPRRADQP
jgi:hypothetical protein